jgi:hypothetical protein
MFTCEFCDKEFTMKGNLLAHQKTTKYCLEKQGKTVTDNFKCNYCNKNFTLKNNLNDHITICKERTKRDCDEKCQLLKDEYDNETKLLMEKYNDKLCQKDKEIEILRDIISKLESKLEKYETRMYDMASRQTINTTNNNNNNKTVVVNMNLPLTNEVLRQCATTFTIDNARTITGITKHLTSSLEDHIICTDPSRNIFKYTNEKDEEIIDQDLENLIPQYLTAVKDRNNFLYDEVCKYFTENNIPLNVQTDYAVFYNALNSIIEKKGQQSKYTEKCKQRMVRECRKQFLEKNKNKEKEITKKMTDEEVMMMVIESGGSVNEFIDRIFPNRDIDDDDDELFNYRRKLEDKFISKKREWKKLKCL